MQTYILLLIKKAVWALGTAMPPPHLSLPFPPTCHCHSGPILRSPHVARPSHRRATPFSSSSALRYTPTPARRPPCSATPPSSSRRGCPRPPPHPLRRPNLRSRCLHFPSTPLFPLHHQPCTVTAAPTIPLPPPLSPHAPPTEKKIAAAAMQRLSLGSPAGKNSRLSVAADEEAEATDEKAAKAMVRAPALNRSIHLVPVLTLLCFLVLFLLSHDPSATLTGMSPAPRRVAGHPPTLTLRCPLSLIGPAVTVPLPVQIRSCWPRPPPSPSLHAPWRPPSSLVEVRSQVRGSPSLTRRRHRQARVSRPCNVNVSHVVLSLFGYLRCSGRDGRVQRRVPAAEGGPEAAAAAAPQAEAGDVAAAVTSAQETRS
jgi:hypothetical protein